MSQVLEKPILLDETGQDISSKINGVGGKIDSSSTAIVEALDDIKEAIGVSGDFTPVMIKVTTPPAKIAYMAGEPLDLAGIVVSLIAANGVHIDVTDQCTFNPANGTTLTSADTSVAISYYWYKDDVTFTTTFPIGIKELDYITITTPPTQTEYVTGDTLDLTGIVVVATYDDGTFLDVTANCTFSPADGATLTANDTTITVSYTEAGITKTATQNISVTPIYGVEWDGSATTTWTRTESAANFTNPSPAVNNRNGSSPFDSIMPWSGIERVEDATAGTLVKIPKFWFKWTADGNAIKIQISNQELEGFSVSPAHSDRGDGQGERDFVYVGAYHCDSTYKSVTGTTPAKYSRENWLTNIQSLGGEYYPMDYAMYMTIFLLYLVEYADWNSSYTIGFGANDNAGVNGGCDAMIYHTGTKATSRQADGQIRYRYIENLWGTIDDHLAGVVSNRTNTQTTRPRLEIALNPAGFSRCTDTSSSADQYFINAGTFNLGSSTSIAEYITKFAGPPIRWAAVIVQNSSVTGNSTSYCCDRYDVAKGTCLPVLIGGVGQALTGLFRLSASTSSAGASVGARIMKLPANS